MKKHCAGRMNWTLTMGLFVLPLFAWGYSRQSITFNGYTRSETLTNFPALVTFTNYTGFLSTNGYDLRFWSNSTETGTPLNYEIDTWTNGGTSYVWVQVPSLSTGTSIWATWGDRANNSQAAYTTNGATWANYIGVWHGGTPTVLSTNDSSTNLSHSVAQTGTIGPGTGVVSGAPRFPGSGDVNTCITNGGMGSLPQNGSIEFWMFPSYYTSSQYPNACETRAFGGNTGMRWELGSNNNSFTWVIGNEQTNHTDFSIITAGNITSQLWYSVGSTWNVGSSNVSAVVNGRVTVTGTTTNFPSTIANFGFGGGYYARTWPGMIDEVRISSVARSTNWLWATYQNMASNTVFNLYGPQVSVLQGTGCFFH